MSNLTAKDLFGSMTALVTPMSTDGQINYEQWQNLIKKQIKAGINAIVVAGTTGESAMLNADEVKQLTILAVACTKGTKTKVIVGTGHVCAQRVIENNHQAAQLGAHAVLVVTPYYIRTTQKGLEQHYKSIADKSPLPMILYNVPTRTQNDLLPETTTALAQHPMIIGIKEAVAKNDRIKQLLEKVPQDFAVLSGDDDSFCESMQQGAVGVISVASNLRPQSIVEICNYLALGDVISAKKCNSSLDSLYKMLSYHPNPIPVKYLLHQVGLIDTGIRMPLIWFDGQLVGIKKEIEHIKKEL